MNDFKSATTYFSRNGLCYSTIVKDTIDLLGTLSTQDHDILRLGYRKDAQDAISFA